MELKEFIKTIAKTLNRKGINYMIIGGQAVLIYGEPRLTRDIDITLGIGVEKCGIIEEIIKDLSLKIIPENHIDFVKQTMVLPVIDEKSGMRIDFIFSYSEYEKEALKRVNKIKIDDIEVSYASVEDLIIHKIIAGRERDLEDVKNILLKNRDIDKKYIKKWLLKFEKILNEKLVERFNRVINCYE
ncbi:MAG: nucleotidyltransferase [Candidatus Omnitrophica bacterium]|nr:nucleotidyltransferase [Candidatus Omnitrophota bacterium]MCM8803350.1 nucleotidyltransferase [Candidatus Omnitrophota bacterium]